ncbi:acriflavin resistance protein [Paludibacter propionicigenes WB4]|uniref:Acriflavin resistance protein n=1 Tax=Paludibacter propionicigenes (strain DSM 17365 / JCM 13257 / WB4) TaxID=694427 RepID=E4T4Q8_PALPW|nr:efflux RND transporter permease subunit [Paludibacter propionicigenes]ADQ79702.1 acriflavin resistance protein [Paludibacter propionicigenes WB4]
MIKYLLNRPIAVFMVFTAFFILGLVTYMNIPISLLPDIAIPEITVKISGKNTSARELENTVVKPIRLQLLQIGNLRDIHTETQDGNAIVRLKFEYGANTDLAFIEVNEKIDLAMNFIPKTIDRPRVVKASATDIPVFNLNLTLKNEKTLDKTDQTEFINLCEFSENVIKRRIEQLPQVAMVDVTGEIKKQVILVPNHNLLEISGITNNDIESALANNNIDPGSMTVRDGYYEYNIKFSTIVRSVEDIENIFIRKNDKIYRLKDLASVKIVPEKETGMAFYNGKRAVVMQVIKQNNEKISSLKSEIARLTDDFKRKYPNIDFTVSQNQTVLLDYTISNLEQNLYIAFIFVCFVSAIFLKDIRTSIIISLNMVVSLVICFLFFYLFGVSLNMISLTGLVLASGMMIDNSIIVTDNISQYRRKRFSIQNSCIKGTNEVIAPMLTSSFTTTSVFVPLIFLSGMAGALFFDQAFSVSVGLFVSYLSGIIFLPICYKLVYSVKLPENWLKKENERLTRPVKDTIFDKIYDWGTRWTFSHKALTMIVMVCIFPLCSFLFWIIPKEKMPYITQNEMIVKIDWNDNIHLSENKDRVETLIKSLNGALPEHAVYLGQQQFLLNKEKEQTTSEAEIYMKALHVEDIPNLKRNVTNYLAKNYPFAAITIFPVGNIFERIFETGEPDLCVELYPKNGNSPISRDGINKIEQKILKETHKKPTATPFLLQMNLKIDREKLLLYNVSYEEVYNVLKTAFKENEVAVLRSYQQYLPIVLSGEERTVNEIITNTLVKTSSFEQGRFSAIPLSNFLTVTYSEDLKSIIAGKQGEYVPLQFYDTKHPDKIIEKVKSDASVSNNWNIDFSGSFFSNKKMINELIVILLISISLMYFILAAQFENFVLPLIVLLEIPIDITASLGLLIVLGHSLNLMSAIGIVVSAGIIINDSILKVDMMNQLRKTGIPLMDAIHESGRRRLKAILMTTFTSIVCMSPLLFGNDIGSQLETPLALGIIGGMVIGTPVSLFVVPLVYWLIYRKKEVKVKA